MTNPIGALFGRSPIKPIQAHMARAQHCVESLGRFIDACLKQDWQLAEELQGNITQAKQDADEIRRDLQSHLPRSLFMPVARTDLLELLRFQDRIANRARSIAVTMQIRKMQIPGSLHKPVKDYVSSVSGACAVAARTINELDELLETAFRGREADFVESLIDELDRLEQESEASQTELRTRVFQQEDSLPPVEVMFIYRIIDLVGDIALSSRKVGGRLLLLMAR